MSKVKSIMFNLMGHLKCSHAGCSGGSQWDLHPTEHPEGHPFPDTTRFGTANDTSLPSSRGPMEWTTAESSSIAGSEKLYPGRGTTSWVE